MQRWESPFYGLLIRIIAGMKFYHLAKKAILDKLSMTQINKTIIYAKSFDVVQEKIADVICSMSIIFLFYLFYCSLFIFFILKRINTEITI